METTAVVFPEANRFETRRLTLDDPGPADMVVRTVISAISPGTERWTLRGLHIGTRFPCVPGYHRIGRVEAVGSEVTKFQPGDLVYGTGNRWQGEVISMWGAHVGLSVSGVGGYYPVPDGLEPDILDALSFTVLCGVSNRGIRFAAPEKGWKTLHIGAGIVGVCAAQLAARRGAEPVLLDKDPERIAHVRRAFPAIPCLSVDDSDLEDRLKELAPGGFDLLQDTVGHAPTTDRLVSLMRAQGVLLLQAQYFDKEKCALDLDQIKIKELTVKTTCGIRQDDWEQTSENIIAGRLNVAPLITHTFAAPAEFDKGYELLHTGRPHSIGIVFHWE